MKHECIDQCRKIMRKARLISLFILIAFPKQTLEINTYYPLVRWWHLFLTATAVCGGEGESDRGARASLSRCRRVQTELSIRMFIWVDKVPVCSLHHCFIAKSYPCRILSVGSVIARFCCLWNSFISWFRCNKCSDKASHCSSLINSKNPYFPKTLCNY